MTPALLILIVVIAAGACCLVAVFESIANGTPAERKAYRDKRAKDDMEALLRGDA